MPFCLHPGPPYTPINLVCLSCLYILPVVVSDSLSLSSSLLRHRANKRSGCDIAFDAEVRERHPVRIIENETIPKSLLRDCKSDVALLKALDVRPTEERERERSIIPQFNITEYSEKNGEDHHS